MIVTNVRGPDEWLAPVVTPGRAPRAINHVTHHADDLAIEGASSRTRLTLPLHPPRLAPDGDRRRMTPSPRPHPEHPPGRGIPRYDLARHSRAGRRVGRAASSPTPPTRTGAMVVTGACGADEWLPPSPIRSAPQRAIDRVTHRADDLEGEASRTRLAPTLKTPAPPRTGTAAG